MIDMWCAPFFFIPSMIIVFYQPQLSGSVSKSPNPLELRKLESSKHDSTKVSAYITRWRSKLLKLILF